MNIRLILLFAGLLLSVDAVHAEGVSIDFGVAYCSIATTYIWLPVVSFVRCLWLQLSFSSDECFPFSLHVLVKGRERTKILYKSRQMLLLLLNSTLLDNAAHEQFFETEAAPTETTMSTHRRQSAAWNLNSVGR